MRHLMRLMVRLMPVLVCVHATTARDLVRFSRPEQVERHFTQRIGWLRAATGGREGADPDERRQCAPYDNPTPKGKSVSPLS